jgi:hypothetical protein
LTIADSIDDCRLHSGLLIGLRLADRGIAPKSAIGNPINNHQSSLQSPNHQSTLQSPIINPQFNLQSSIENQQW